MIVMIEGPRHCGKTYLLENFFRTNANPDIMYYKFAFAKYIDDLSIRDHETGAGVHYFSIANVMTILELNQTVFKDKLLVFDRSIFSAYVWSIYRKRMDRDRLLNEFRKILSSDLYQNCCVINIDRINSIEVSKREKDFFGNFEDYAEEWSIFEMVYDEMSEQMINAGKNTSLIKFMNHFNDDSLGYFNELINQIADDK
jgi:hypothetical protein